MKLIGLAVLVVAVVVVAITYHRHMSAIYRDIAEHEAERLAEQRFREMIQTARVQLRQRIEIIDETNENGGTS